MTNQFVKCSKCDDVANSVILDFKQEEYLDVCETHYSELFMAVANEGVDTFVEWAEAMYGKDRAKYLTDEVFGFGSYEEVVIEEEYDENDRVWMFTFGTLKYPYSIARDGGKDIVENCTVRGHKLHLYHTAFPVTRITNDENDIVYGTLFTLPRYVMENDYDLIEGYDPRAHPSRNMYNRIEADITRPDGTVEKAFMYYANQEQFKEYLIQFTEIPEGNFDNKYKTPSYDYFLNQKRYR